MRSGRVLRQVVRSRIIAQVPALTGVYDKATEGSVFPYATLGPSYWVSDDAECIEGRSVTLQIDVWHSASNKGVLEDLTDDVCTALRGYADTVALTMHPIDISIVRVMDDPDGVSVHGIIQIEALVENGDP